MGFRLQRNQGEATNMWSYEPIIILRVSSMRGSVDWLINEREKISDKLVMHPQVKWRARLNKIPKLVCDGD